MQTSIYAFDGGDACESLTHDSLSRPIGRIGRIVPKRLDMLLTEPEIAAATLDHQHLIPIVMTARRRTFRGDKQGRSFPHRDALFPAGANADVDHSAHFAVCMPQDTCQRPAKGRSGAARGWRALRRRCYGERERAMVQPAGATPSATPQPERAEWSGQEGALALPQHATHRRNVALRTLRIRWKPWAPSLSSYTVKD